MLLLSFAAALVVVAQTPDEAKGYADWIVSTFGPSVATLLLGVVVTVLLYRYFRPDQGTAVPNADRAERRDTGPFEEQVATLRAEITEFRREDGAQHDKIGEFLAMAEGRLETMIETQKEMIGQIAKVADSFDRSVAELGKVSETQSKLGSLLDRMADRRDDDRKAIDQANTLALEILREIRS